MLKKVAKKVKEWRYVTVATLLSMLILVYYAVQLSVPVISDETVTMANAAWATGRDWSLMIASLGGLYYRFLQAFMTIPFFNWSNNPDFIYRASMILQALIHASIVPVVCVICKKYLKAASDGIICVLAVAICFVPSIALYVLYYRGDYLLSVLPWYVLLLFLKILEAEKQGKNVKRAVYTILAVICCIMAYMAHMRGIILIVALVISAIYVRLVLNRKSLHWPCFFGSAVCLFMIDDKVGRMLKTALYTLSGLNANALESTDLGEYFNIFSLRTLKNIIVLCVSWLNTLICTTDGLVLIGFVVGLVILYKAIRHQIPEIKDAEIVVIVFSLMVFLGYYAVGALLFKDVYHPLLTGEVTRRTDRLLYDRYAICGAGMMIFIALYGICFKTQWVTWRIKAVCIACTAGAFGVFLWKILPIVVKYKGYIYNTITLNSFQKIEDASKILSGEFYNRFALLCAMATGLVGMSIIIAASSVRKKWMASLVLLLVCASEFLLIQVNFVKIRKAANDYVIEATEQVVDFMQMVEDDMADTYPYVLKGGLSGVKIQFYQSQLMDFQLFGKKQIEYGGDNFFIISSHDDIDATWNEGDYYFFEDFDYGNAAFDVVYVKGEQLKKRLEALGYRMRKYEETR